ncbi:MAPEG family protein [Tistlia consotensis]|uniref:MAPEG family protein n=1 Tax=Tistlia consotensis USBA 355 TaxID=560819 RepID=A0A1Y6B8H8_9PROT|nr:MAPEG family protein [Tistlia consotensis]SME98360.1 MAPEG family protein [Tistlia consotensis USBA 355]SNR57726.1 MAPEG family protein [Tistlia consotensis]
MALDKAQHGVLRGMLAALALSIVALAGAVLWQPAFLQAPAPIAERLAAALRWEVLPLLCLVAAIGNLARHRFFTPADIDGSGLTAGTERARVFQSVLQNTLEQLVIALLAHLLWVAAAPPAWFGAVPVAAVLFLVGRISFAAGYAGGAPARAVGFALTFYPTLLLTLGSVLLLRRVAGG